MNRRSLLSMFGAGLAAGAVLDPDMLSWVPGSRVTSIPKPFEPISLFEDFEIPFSSVTLPHTSPNRAGFLLQQSLIEEAAIRLREKVDLLGYRQGNFLAPPQRRARNCGWWQGRVSFNDWESHPLIPSVGGVSNVSMRTIFPYGYESGSGRLDIILAPRG